MKAIKAAVSVLLAFSLLFTGIVMSTAAEPTAAVQQTEEKTGNDLFWHRLGYNILDYLLNTVVGAIGAIIPNPDWEMAEEYVSENLCVGTSTFLDEPAENAKWSLGYSSASLLTGNELDGKHYVGGTIRFYDKVATEVYDDLRVRTIAVDDGSGRGITVFAVIDAYGLANSDVREIRSRLASYAAEKNIVSINVSVLHQHSAVDTFGMNGNIYAAAFLNPILNLLGVKTTNGKNADYMENLFNVTAQSVKNAVGNMTTGKMYFSKVDVTDYIWDRRNPQVNDTNLNRFRFVPDNGSRDTWLVTSIIHCVGNSSERSELTGDYPYYVEKVINSEADANMIMLMGAQQSNSMRRNTTTVEGFYSGMPYLEVLSKFGTSLGKKLVAIDNSTETEVAPLLNIKHKEINLRIDNNVMLVAGKCGLFTNKVVKTDTNKFEVVTEIGYMELGTDLAFAMIPGELAPEIAYGGCLEGEDAWNYGTWDYPYIKDLARDGRELRVLGLTNDQVGYIVPDNNFMSMLAEESQSVEFVSLGKNTASTIVGGMSELINSID